MSRKRASNHPPICWLFGLAETRSPIFSLDSPPVRKGPDYLSDHCGLPKCLHSAWNWTSVELGSYGLQASQAVSNPPRQTPTLSTTFMWRQRCTKTITKPPKDTLTYYVLQNDFCHSLWDVTLNKSINLRRRLSPFTSCLHWQSV